MNTHAEQVKYFSNNRERTIARYADLHQAYISIYDLVLTKTHVSSARNAITLALLLRSATYTNTAHEIALFGHIEEARIILRSPVELMLVALMVSQVDDAWFLWQKCHALSTQNSQGGLVDITELRSNEFEINYLIKKYSRTMASDSMFAELKRMRGEFSTYWSHQNLYNIVSRVEHTSGKVTLYIGTDADSDNLAIQKLLFMTTHLMTIVNDLSIRISGG